jgi:hypothetical protein
MEENKDVNKNLQQNILDKIKSENVKMTPRQFFIMRWVTLVTTSLFFLIFGIYILAYVIFLFIDNGLIYIPLFSESGVVDFIVEVPWTLVFLGLLSVFFFSITSKTFYKIYKKPFLTFFFSILMIIVISHLILVTTGGMQYIKEEAYKEKLHLVPSKFLDFRDSQTGTLLVGYVLSTTSNSLIIRDRKNNLMEIVGESLGDLNNYQVGQLVNVYGGKDNDTFQAKIIEVVR